MRIVVDAMGSDNCPAAQIGGALQALSLHNDLQITLVGPQRLLAAGLGGQGRDRISVVDAPDAIEPTDEPVRSIRRKDGSSMVMALRLAADGAGDAVVSAGNTGALVAGGLFITRRLAAVSRPALATVMPTLSGGRVLFLDLGAGVDPRPEHLLQHGLMGVIYSREILGSRRPRLGLLNIGSEPGKGNQLAKDAHRLLAAAGADGEFEFLGNVEGRDLLGGDHDVIVADGFVGNVALKVIEGVGLGILGMLKQEISASRIYQLGALLMRPAFARVRRRMDYSEYGGAPLLGLQGVVVKCHGSSDARAITSGIRQALHMVERRVPAVIGQRLASGKDEV